MKRKPLEDYRTPAYPGREDGEADAPQFVPNRWRTHSKVAGAMAWFLFPLAGVANDAQPAVTPPAADKKKQVPQAPVARVFEHGEGRGAFGCVAVAPPAFLTEADAKQVILEEFQREGVQFQLKTKVLPAVEMHETEHSWIRGKDGRPVPIVEEKPLYPLILDGYDPVHQIGFEYVDTSNYFKLGGVRDGSSVTRYDFKKIAQETADRASKDPSVHLGVFYDPMSDGYTRGEDRGYVLKRGESEDALRKQVRDFIAWLKQEKIL